MNNNNNNNCNNNISDLPDHLPLLQRQGLGVLPISQIKYGIGIKEFQRINYNNPAGFVQNLIPALSHPTMLTTHAPLQPISQNTVNIPKKIQQMKPIVPIAPTSHNHSYLSGPTIDEMSENGHTHLPSWQANYRPGKAVVVVPTHAHLLAKEGVVRRQ